MKTRITELLGIDYPILQGGMFYVSTPELVAAVSNAGGMGFLSSAMYPKAEAFQNALQKTRALTDRPIGVNMSFLPDADQREAARAVIADCKAAGVTAVETSGVKPDFIEPLIHGAGLMHIHKVPAARYGLSAEKCGVDAVSVVGFECGGHPGKDEKGTMVLIDEASRALSVPVIAGGGIVDGRGVAAALMLGADAVVMGTRFLASEEAPISEAHKQWLCAAGERSTVIVQKSVGNMARVANNAAARQCLAMEAQGANFEALQSVTSGARTLKAYQTGDVDGGINPVGQGVSLIREVKSVLAIVQELVAETQTQFKRFEHILS
ncbi:nitronate monooxygenase [Pseudoramibacter faecis]|uniref:NAD(P)H-dependent flavin oxidoreductase n=1 Tax=Pseudoramibacter faecis TaxID=3108534 RepID=UPI002E763D6E|nr:nitronate monooxygenase [Pseudoramibacter sp. HA2172]